MSKESSDELATKASELLRGDPDYLLPDQIADNVIDAVGKAHDRTHARKAVREALEPLFTRIRSFAGSVVSQADGPE